MNARALQSSHSCTHAPPEFHIVKGTASLGMCAWQSEQNGAISEPGLLQTRRSSMPGLKVGRAVMV
jgi:hypothetical protein